jgi:hypothetical protein
MNFNINYLSDESTDDFEYIECKKNKCQLCDVETFKCCSSFDFINKKIYKTCILCNIIINFKKSYIGKFIFVNSKMSQKEINNKTIEYYKKYQTIIKPDILDKKCKLIIISPYMLSKMFDIMRFDDLIHFKNYKIMFTGEITKNFNEPKNVFIKKVEQIKYDNSYFDIDKYEFKNEKIIIDKYFLLITELEKRFSLSIQSSLFNKIVN